MKFGALTSDNVILYVVSNRLTKIVMLMLFFKKSAIYYDHIGEYKLIYFPCFSAISISPMLLLFFMVD